MTLERNHITPRILRKCLGPVPVLLGSDRSPRPSETGSYCSDVSSETDRFGSKYFSTLSSGPLGWLITDLQQTSLPTRSQSSTSAAMLQAAYLLRLTQRRSIEHRELFRSKTIMHLYQICFVEAQVQTAKKQTKKKNRKESAILRPARPIAYDTIITNPLFIQYSTYYRCSQHFGQTAGGTRRKLGQMDNDRPPLCR